MHGGFPVAIPAVLPAAKALTMSVRTEHTGHGATPEDAGERLSALARVLDWAEAEAALLRAPDASICLQLARLALEARRRDS
jgi:hypothetical protein